MRQCANHADYRAICAGRAISILPCLSLVEHGKWWNHMKLEEQWLANYLKSWARNFSAPPFQQQQHKNNINLGLLLISKRKEKRQVLKRSPFLAIEWSRKVRGETSRSRKTRIDQISVFKEILIWLVQQVWMVNRLQREPESLLLSVPSIWPVSTREIMDPARC